MSDHGVKCECEQCGSQASVDAHEHLAQLTIQMRKILGADLVIVTAFQHARPEYPQPMGMSVFAETAANLETRRLGSKLLRELAITLERAGVGALVPPHAETLEHKRQRVRALELERFELELEIAALEHLRGER